MDDFPQFLEYVTEGLDASDAAALVDVSDLDAYLDAEPDRRKELAKAEAQFRLRMVRVLTSAAEIKRSVGAAVHFLRKKQINRAQLTLDFAPAHTTTLDMPDNRRGPTT